MRPILWIISVLLLAGAGYFTYDRLSKNSALNNWSFMPENAAIVYESDNGFQSLDKLTKTTFWSTLNEMSGFSDLSNSVQYLTEVTNGQFQSLFTSNKALISVHSISRNEFDFLFVLEVSSINAFQQLQTIQNHFENKGLSKKNRTYLGFTITEISYGADTFTFIFHKNYLVGSFSAFLVEDAIRTFEDPSKPNFQEKYIELQTIAKLDEDDGNVYVNFQGIGDLFSAFSKENQSLQEQSGYLDIEIKDNSLEFNGFIIPSDTVGSFLNSHLGVTPGTMDIPSIMPLETSMVQHFSFADPGLWASKLDNYLRAHDKDAIADRKILKNDADFDVEAVFNYLDDEIALLHFAGISASRKALILEVKDVQAANSFFKDIAGRFAKTQSDSLYSEVYQDYTISLLPAKNFPKALLGKRASGFNNCYFTNIDNQLIFASELFLLKDIIRSVQEENVWTKSLRKNQFLEQINEASNYSIFVNTPDYWQEISKNINPFWSEYFIKNAPYLKSFDNIALQFSNIDDRFFTNLVVYQTEPPKVGIREVETRKSLVLPHPIITQPFIVRNHNNNAIEVFLQDSLLNAYLLDGDFKTLWSAPLSGPVKDRVFQIDYYRNGKLQIAFVAGSSLYIIDRNGSLLPGFPRPLEGLENVQYFNLIDYDGSKNYRFSFTDQKGRIMLTDKNGKALKGWNTKNLGTPLIGSLDHYRIGKRDVMIAITKNGVIQVFNRRGERESNFPLDLQVPISNHYHINKESDLASSTITIVSEIGEVISVNLEGQITRKEQLYKRAAEMRYDILSDFSKNYFLITTQDNQTWSLLNGDGLELFQKEYLIQENLIEQFYRISAGKELILITDRDEKKSYAFDLEGQLLTATPISATQAISVIYSSKEDAFNLYTVDGNNLSLNYMPAR